LVHLIRYVIGYVRTTSNLSKAHETRDSLQQFLFAGFSGLFPSISLQFTVEVCAAAENRRKNH